MKNAKTIVFAFIVLLIGVTPLLAQGHGGGCACGRATNGVWQIEEPNAAFFAAAASEFERWNLYINAFTATQGDNTAGRNGQNEILFATPTEVRQFWNIGIDEDVFGVAFLSPESSFGNFNACPMPAGTFCGNFTESDVLMNQNFARGWTAKTPADFDDNVGPALYGATAVHEIGHAIGLHHNFRNLSTMNYYEDFAAQYLGRADTSAVRAQYPSLVRNVTDLALMPFFYLPGASQYSATSPVEFGSTITRPGGVIDIAFFTLENIGTNAAPNVNISFFLSRDQTLSVDDILIADLPIGSLTTDQIVVVDDEPVRLLVPENVPQGSFFLIGYVTMNGVEDEVEYNNAFTAPQQITVGRRARNARRN